MEDAPPGLAELPALAINGSFEPWGALVPAGCSVPWMDAYTNTRSFLALAVTALVLGCSSAAHSPASRRDSYAQATCTDTVTCCVQRNPGAPEACGLSASEAASLMAGAKAAGRAAAATDSAAQEWDDSHNAALPDWKRECIRFYGDCREGKLSGSCYDCLRNGRHPSSRPPQRTQANTSTARSH